MRNIFIAGNWKMNKDAVEVREFFTQMRRNYLRNVIAERVKVVIAPAFPFIPLTQQMANDTQLIIAAQNVSEHEKGAFTGEVSARMLKSLEIQYCIVGHSERRKYFGDNSKTVPQKLNNLRLEKIKPIFCIGETLQQREEGLTEKIIIQQLENGLTDFKLDSGFDLVIAYEPVWAIGTGKTATPEQAQEIHLLIRNWLANHYSNELAQDISILYGGSVNPSNLDQLLDQPDIDGGLIGGAAMDDEKFVSMVKIGTQKV